MKKIIKKIQNKILLTLILIISFTIITPPKASAFIDFANLGVNIGEKIRNTVHDVEDYIQVAQTAASSFSTAKSLVQQITHINLSDQAQNLAADQILNYGSTILQAATGDQGVGVNINTNGDQVITNLGNYIDKIGVNEIRKSIENLKNSENITPYSDEILKDISTFTRKISDTAAGKLVTFNLPYITRDEICNSLKLKDIIKNGEPKDFLNPKAAVGNVDIDKACNSATTMTAEDQAVFVGLARGGYGGQKTSEALSDYSNTESGVKMSAMATIEANKEAAETLASKQAEATNLNIGQQVCFDKDGKKVEYDPTSKDETKQFCYSTNSTVDQSGSQLSSRTTAALLSPYFSLLARAQSTTNQVKNCLGGSSGGAPEDHGASNGGGSSGGSTGHGTGFIKNIFKTVFQTAYADDFTDGTTKALSGVNNCVSAVSSLFSSVTNLVGTALNLGSGASDVSAAISGVDSPYSRLADDLDNMSSTITNQNALYAKSIQDQKNYETGNTVYSAKDLQDRISIYDNFRKLNTTKLNQELFSYAFVQLAIANDSRSIGLTDSQRRGCSLFSCSKSKSTDTIAANTQNAIIGLYQVNINLGKDIRNLIKEMARNNYIEQQLKSLLTKIQTGVYNIDDIDAQNTLKSLLGPGNSLTNEDYSNDVLDWNYIPKIVEIFNDPTQPDQYTEDMSEKDALKAKAADSLLLIPTKDEMNGPYTDQNTTYILTRAWKTYKKGIGTSQSIPIITLGLGGVPFYNIVDLPTPVFPDLLTKFGMTNFDDINPNMPRVGTYGAVDLLSADQHINWSEQDYCVNLYIVTTSICSDSAIQDLLKEYTNELSISLPSDESISEECADVPAYIDKQCQTSTNTNYLSECQNNKQSLIDDMEAYCSDGENASSTNGG